MKVHRNYKGWGLTSALLMVSVFILIAWTGNPQQPKALANQSQDTIPSKQKTRVTRQPGDRDLDYELRQLEKAKEDMKDVDWNDISEKMNNAFKGIDMEKISKEIEKARVSVDFDKIQQQIEGSLKSIDFDKIQKEISESLNESLSKVDMEKISKELDKAKIEVTEELKKQDWKKELEEAKKFDFTEQMKNAGKEIEKATVEVKGYQEMIYAMESEGLLNTKEDYRIEYKAGELSINGVKQSQDITDKYKKYFPEKKLKIVIKKKDGEMHLDYGNSNVHID
jgi:hypothetical protein